MVYQNEVTGIYYLKTYIPYRLASGEVNSRFNQDSGSILDIKSADPETMQKGINYFSASLDAVIPKDAIIVVVPSHNPQKTNSGMHMMGQWLSSKGSRTDATHCLVRTYPIAKLAHGGNRHIDVHTQSITVSNVHLIQNRNVILLDDVATTGNSLLACANKLISAGAISVTCLAIAQTE